MEKYVPTKLESFTYKNGTTLIRHSLPGHVRLPGIAWVSFDASSGLTEAIQALWQTIDVPEVFRTKVGNRSARFTKGSRSGTVVLLGSRPPAQWNAARLQSPGMPAVWDGLNAFEVADPGWDVAIKAAVGHFWGSATSELTKSKSADSWSFTCTPDRVDIARCLREAYDAGLREVMITIDCRCDRYIHREVWDLLNEYDRAHGKNTSRISSDLVDWHRVTHGPCLALARAWKTKQTKQTVRVEVSGTK